MRKNVRLAAYCFLLAACCAVRAVAASATAEATTHGVGEVSFANSGAAAAQPAFLRALALLHNFEYEDAAESFRRAQAADPGFAMAYWGEAMTYTHPVWMQQDRDAARAALARLAATPAERAAKAASERERAYLGTLEVLYGEGSKEQRDDDYAAAMATLHDRYPDDVDATAFYALSLLGTAHQGRDFATYMKAAALLEEVFPAHSHHPGVLHYLIHCYDDAVHAPLGMRAARLYGAVAPDAGHALHMTSHIFIALGQWDDVVAANQRAMTVVNGHRHGAGKHDRRCGHYVEWLHYAYLQVGRTGDAEHELEQCRQEAMDEAREPEKVEDPDSSSIAGWAQMRLRQVVDTGMVPAATMTIPPHFAAAQLAVAYGDVYAAAAAGAAERAREAATRFAAAQAELTGARKKPLDPVVAKAVAAAGLQVDALVALAAGQRAEALQALDHAVAAEQAIPLVFGPPVVEKPSRELLGEQLLAAGRVADAKAAFGAVLAQTPGRTAALRGLLQSQTALGERQAATQTEAQLSRNLHRPAPAGGGR